jgi:Fe-S-cluster containining protein
VTEQNKVVFVDCEAGRRLGCQTFCCRLLVALRPHEREAPRDGLPARGYVPKDAEGLCVHMNPETWRCNIWDERPETCREYTCNDDFKLQVVLREGFHGIADLARKAASAYIPRETYVRVPALGEEQLER